jgi:putative colanic acid biosynthesis acetyltransferase WcaF
VPILGAPLPAPAFDIDVAANRAARKYTRREQAMRVAWTFGIWLYRLSPRPCFAWRRMLLRLFGAKVGAHVVTYGSTHFYMPWNVEIGDWVGFGEQVFVYSLGRVRFGDKVTISYRTHVCAGSHDLEDPTLPLTKPPVTFEPASWVGTEAFIGPGVTIGRGAVVAARSVVVKDVEPLNIVGGHPARVIGLRGGPRRPGA